MVGRGRFHQRLRRKRRILAARGGFTAEAREKNICNHLAVPNKTYRLGERQEDVDPVRGRQGRAKSQQDVWDVSIRLTACRSGVQKANASFASVEGG